MVWWRQSWCTMRSLWRIMMYIKGLVKTVMMYNDSLVKNYDVDWWSVEDSHDVQWGSDEESSCTGMVWRESVMMYIEGLMKNHHVQGWCEDSQSWCTGMVWRQSVMMYRDGVKTVSHDVQGWCEDSQSWCTLRAWWRIIMYIECLVKSHNLQGWCEGSHDVYWGSDEDSQGTVCIDNLFLPDYKWSAPVSLLFHIHIYYPFIQSMPRQWSFPVDPMRFIQCWNWFTKHGLAQYWPNLMAFSLNPRLISIWGCGQQTRSRLSLWSAGPLGSGVKLFGNSNMVSCQIWYSGWPLQSWEGACQLAHPQSKVNWLIHSPRSTDSSTVQANLT